MQFFAEKGLAACGLACPVCSVADCPGCARKGCQHMDACGVFHCAQANHFKGCYECSDFPCAQEMLKSGRLRAFVRYARRYGPDRMIARLRENQLQGIVYHHGTSLKGDYDAAESELDILTMLEFGKDSDPYRTCPAFETEHFRLRLIAREDAEGLLDCYADPAAQALFNADNCTSDFRYTTLDEMRACVDMFLGSYQDRQFVRWTIVDKETDKPVGTVEMFANERSVLRVDIASRFETEPYLSPLFHLLTDKLRLLFRTEQIVTKAPQAAKARIAVLQALGYAPISYEGRADYFISQPLFEDFSKKAYQ